MWDAPPIKIIIFHSLQLLCKANNPVCFFKSHVQVEAQTLYIVQLAVAGKFYATLFLSPFPAGGQKFSGNPLFAVVLRNIDALQIAHG